MSAESRWAATGWRYGLVLALAQLPIAAFLLLASFPGRANIDIRNQAEQALGRIPFTDWHPPAMSLLWRWLVEATGQMGSLLVVQVLGLCAATWLLCRYIASLGGGRVASAAGLLLPLTPTVLSQIGVLWKDTQMGVAFLLALLLCLRIDARRPRTWLWLLPVVAFLLYGSLVRKNGLAAVPPVLAVIAWQGWLAWRGRAGARRRGAGTAVGVPARVATDAGDDAPADEPAATGARKPGGRRRAFLACTAATAAASVLFAGLTVLGDKAVAHAVDVQPTGASLQPLLDDVIFTIPAAELAREPLPRAYRERLLRAQELCAQKGSTSDAYWRCYGRGVGGGNFSPLDHQDELKALWLAQVPSHPGRYLAYRGATYGHFLTHSVLVWWETPWQGDARAVGLGNAAGPADDAARWWVMDVWERHLGVVYLPVFWLALAVLGFAVARWAGRARTMLLAASSSALLYLLAYFPVIPAPHFRYSWWPALVLTAAWLVATALGLQRWAARLAGRARGSRRGAGVNTPQESTGHAAPTPA